MRERFYYEGLLLWNIYYGNYLFWEIFLLSDFSSRRGFWLCQLLLRELDKVIFDDEKRCFNGFYFLLLWENFNKGAFIMEIFLCSFFLLFLFIKADFIDGVW